jgi:hypothetical protein
MTDNQQQVRSSTPSSLGVVAFLYFLAIMLDLITYQPPSIRPDTPAQITYEVFGLILGLLPLLVIGLSSQNANISKLQISFSKLSLPVKGLILIVCAIVLKSAFTLALLLPISSSAPGRIMIVLIETVILLFKWGGIGLLAWALVHSLYQKTRMAETKGQKLKDQIAFGLFAILFLIVIASNIWSDMNGIISRF